MLKDAADALDLEIYMALADVQETWNCEVDHDLYYYRRGRYTYYSNRKEQGKLATDLFDSNTVLKHWIDRENNLLNYKECTVPDHEFSWTKANNELKPFQSEYEGFMGNYGNTLEQEVFNIITSLLLYWLKQIHQHNQSKDYPTVFKLALYVKNPFLAQSMLFCFNIAVLTSKRAALFLGLQDAYGTVGVLIYFKHGQILKIVGVEF